MCKRVTETKQKIKKKNCGLDEIRIAREKEKKRVCLHV